MTRQAATEALMNAEPTAVIDLFLCRLLDLLAAGLMSLLAWGISRRIGPHLDPDHRGVCGATNSQRLQQLGTGVRPAR